MQAWSTCVRYRLSEKAERLAGYAALLAEAAPDVAERLTAASAYAAEMAALFAKDLGTPEALSETANTLTADHPDKLTSLGAVLADLDARAAGADDDSALALV